MSKYIIKNCPCYTMAYHCKYNCLGRVLSPYCQDCTDCVVKQIVELCEEESSLMQHKQKVKVKYQMDELKRQKTASSIYGKQFEDIYFVNRQI